ncbi:hypothetical protein H6G17_29235 [Chroococcidiopsis sp. FACHB-1243]|uniref:PspA/IM30 family protein n=1 Tax=Chroococcidiopsis sp. [FACHB-1243] TaxID=2692781 RepID=UPI00177D4A7F|nr:hypothetical protein [Chroococcidiopsis sp. [FACHB-1243]]MBD2309528.1 hypothetical protein [Chroococcidiopsis sp. [FACHB-1243]]
MSNSNHRVSMKRKITLLAPVIASIAITGASLPASATVSNTNEQDLTSGQQSVLLLANLTDAEKREARQDAMLSPGYQRRLKEMKKLFNEIAQKKDEIEEKKDEIEKKKDQITELERKRDYPRKIALEAQIKILEARIRKLVSDKEKPESRIRDLQSEQDEIVRNYEDMQRKLRPQREPSPSYHTAPSDPESPSYHTAPSDPESPSYHTAPSDPESPSYGGAP